MASPRGVSFDNTCPDGYSYISPAIEMIELLNFDANEKQMQELKPREQPYTGDNLIEKIKKLCKDIDKSIENTLRDRKKLIEELEENVRKEKKLQPMNEECG